jgi:hypothetical protein
MQRGVIALRATPMKIFPAPRPSYPERRKRFRISWVSPLLPPSMLSASCFIASLAKERIAKGRNALQHRKMAAAAVRALIPVSVLGAI